MRFFIAALLATSATPAFAQRPPEAVSQDLSEAPPINQFGPMAAIPDGLDTAVNGPYRYIDPNGVPAEMDASDPVGAFRINCDTTVTAAQDPIVAPGLRAGSHIHTFFGNTDPTPFDATDNSLRTTGGSTCINRLWRSLYWLPAMLDGPGINAKVVWPSYVVVYYKREPLSSPFCTPGNPKVIGRCVGFPHRLRGISGYDMITQTTPTGFVLFNCKTFWDGNTGGSGSPLQADMVTALSQCPAAPNGATNVKRFLDMEAGMASCWNGKDVDSPNHRSHLADLISVPGVGQFCPKTHPYRIPIYTAQVFYEIDGTVNTSGTWTSGQQTWYLASDRMPGMSAMRPGTTFHFDVYDAANETIKKIVTDNCIDKHLNCSNGVIGDGTGLTPEQPLDSTAPPKSVRPKMAKEAVNITVQAPQ